MNCLSLGQIYLYLDQELSSSENKKIEEHLALCPKCREALEERQILEQAAKSLPDLEIPTGFSQKIMAKLFPERVTFLGWLGALASGLASLFLALFLLFLASGKNLPGLLLNLGHNGLATLKNGALLLPKLFKLLLLISDLLPSLAEELLKGLSSLTTIVSPGIQALIIILICLFLFTLVYGLGRKFLAGEKT